VGARSTFEQRFHVQKAKIYSPAPQLHQENKAGARLPPPSKANWCSHVIFRQKEGELKNAIQKGRHLSNERTLPKV